MRFVEASETREFYFYIICVAIDKNKIPSFRMLGACPLVRKSMFYAVRQSFSVFHQRPPRAAPPQGVAPARHHPGEDRPARCTRSGARWTGPDPGGGPGDPSLGKYANTGKHP